MGKFFALSFLYLALLLDVSHSDTVTIRRDGTTTFMFIKDVLSALDYNNGVDDVILIGPGTYDEQLILQGKAGADSIEFPTSDNVTPKLLESAFLTHQDRLTLRAEDPDNPPVITVKDTTPLRYSFFPDSPTKDFSAAIVLCGNSIQVENIEIRHTTATEHAIGGMGGDIQFVDCRFTTEGTAGSDVKEFFHIANNGDLTMATNEAEVFNEFTFQECIWDMKDVSSPGSGHPAPCFVFDGYDFPSGAGKSDADANGFLFIERCIIRNLFQNCFFEMGTDGNLGSGIRDLVMRDSYGQNILGNGTFTTRGPAPLVQYDRNVFTDIVGSATEGLFHFDSSGANHPSGFLANSIFHGLKENVGVRITGGNEKEGLINIANNTFFDYTAGAVVVEDGNANLTVNVGNNIFNATDEETEAGVAFDLTSSEILVNLFNNGFWKNSLDIIGDPNSEEGSIFGDPSYAGGVTTVVIPVDTGGAPEIQGLNPTNPLFVDGGSLSFYQLIDCVGPYDVDITNNRGSLPITVGAQESDPLKGLSYSPICEPQTHPTRTPTSIPSDTPTITQTTLPTFVNERSDINGDRSVDAEDLLILLGDWGRVSGPLGFKG